MCLAISYKMVFIRMNVVTITLLCLEFSGLPCSDIDSYRSIRVARTSAWINSWFWRYRFSFTCKLVLARTKFCGRLVSLQF